MTNLTPFEEIILAVLKKLQDLCDTTALEKHNTKKGVVYYFGDFFPPVVGKEQMQYVVKYLRINGLEINITNNDNEDDNFKKAIYEKEYGGMKNVPLGLIRGKNIEEIKQAIQKNINKLSPEIKTQSLKEIDENSKVKKLKPKFTAKIKIDHNSVSWNDEKIVAKKGQNGLVRLFIKNANLFRIKKGFMQNIETLNNKDFILFKKGKPLKIDEFMKAGYYSTENSFREGLNNLKGKIKNKKWPMFINPVGGGLYQMTIYFNKK